MDVSALVMSVTTSMLDAADGRLLKRSNIPVKSVRDEYGGPSSRFYCINNEPK